MAHPKIRINEPTFALEHYLDVIALEAGVVENMVNTLKSIMPTFMSKLLPDLKKLDSVIDTKMVALSKDEAKAVKKLPTIEFHYLEKIAFDGPEGFTGDYLQYANVLSKNIDYIRNIAQQVKDYKVFLAGLLSSGDARLSTKDLSYKYKELAKLREAHGDELAAFIKPGSFAVTLPIGKVFQRSSDIERAIVEFSSINKRLKELDLKQIKADVDACVDILNTIIQRVNDGDFESMTPAAAKSLSIGAYEMARNVEYVSIAYYTAMAGMSGVNRLIDKINMF